MSILSNQFFTVLPPNLSKTEEEEIMEESKKEINAILEFENLNIGKRLINKYHKRKDDKDYNNVQVALDVYLIIKGIIRGSSYTWNKRNRLKCNYYKKIIKRELEELKK